MDLFDLISSQLSNQDTLDKLSQTAGAGPSQVQQVTQLGVPALLQALLRNASTTEGAVSLAGALDQHQNDKIDDINEFLKSVDTEDGAKILQHIFGGKNQLVQANLAKQTGLETGQVFNVMTQLAPLLLGALGQQKKQQNLDASGIPGLLNGLVEKGDNSGLMGMVTNLLDADHDGSIVDEVGSLLKGFLKK